MKDLFGYIKLGRLNKKIADEINRKPANIFVDYDHLRHIEKGRGEYLEKLKVNALSYLKKIVDNYSEIRAGKNESLLLVAYMEENDYKNIAVIELNLVLKDNIYLVKTAMPRRREMADSETILWQKQKNS